MSATAAELRREFPLLAAQPELHYLDSAATAQIHGAALDAVLHHETTSRANVARGTYRLAEAADRAYEQARQTAARFLNAGAADEIVFTSGATAALNLVAYAFGSTLRRGDRVLLSEAEHHSNFVPWQMLRERAGIELDLIPVTAGGELDLVALPQRVTAKTRLVAVTQCSNVTGAWTDVAAVVAAARSVGARVLLDGAQAVQHGPQDVRALGIDFYAFSGHKCFGPGGVGVLWGRAEVLAQLPPFLGGGGMIGEVTFANTTWAAPPQRFEAGTPPIAPAVGLAAALEWLMAQDWAQIHAREGELCKRLIAGLQRIPGLRLLGPVASALRAPIVSFDVPGLHPHDICQVLDAHRLALRGGHHCAQPLLAALGVEACTRASIALYNDEADIDALLDGLADAVRTLA
ncbi:MAG: aminotransferase class V-fold PLP-dependent enzyme [Sulfuritalea sp.]|nr:aminotransferase class V-fold PLP-dependent enzyme [Sulfuritalea sp.]